MAKALHALNNECDPLSHADAHGAKRVPAADRLKLIYRGSSEARPGCAERMADSDRSTVRIDVGGVVRKPEIARHGKRLRGERFVELDDFHLRELQPRL